MLYLGADGKPYGGDRQTRADGTLDPIAPDRPSPAHQWDGSAWVLPVLLPDWDTFRTQMMGDGAYQKMAVGAMTQAQGAWLMTTLQDAITMPEPSIPLFAPLWNQIASMTVMKPTAADIDRWNGYAIGNRIGLKFLANGTIG